MVIRLVPLGANNQVILLVSVMINDVPLALSHVLLLCHRPAPQSQHVVLILQISKTSETKTNSHRAAEPQLGRRYLWLLCFYE